MCLGEDKTHQLRRQDDDDTGDFPWHLGVFDAHCHPTDTVSSLQDIVSMKAKVLTVMATRSQDQQLVHQLAEDFGCVEQSSLGEGLSRDVAMRSKVIPSFGWHPWFSYQLYDDTSSQYDELMTSERLKTLHYQSVLRPKPEDDEFLASLPDPQPLSAFLKDTQIRLEGNSSALVGEVGLDKSFRLPEPWTAESDSARNETLTPGGREDRKLSPYRVDMEHQKKILLAQINLAGKLGRPVSCHSVATHGVIFDTLRQTWKGHEREVLSKAQRRRHAGASGAIDTIHSAETSIKSGPSPFPPRICLHSFSGPPEAIKQYLHPSIPCEFFFSFSTAINFASGSTDKVRATIQRIPEDKLLVESDLHTAGPLMDQYLEDVVRRVCEIKGWTLGEGLTKLRHNWERFVFGF